MDRQLISEEDTFVWLSKGNLKAETESKIAATQDQAFNRKYYATKIPYNISMPNTGKRTICKTV
jgi:hypothetical protein